VASVPLEQLRGKRLEAEDFNAYLVPDSIRDLLQWMADPPAFQQRCSQDQWAVLSSTWKKDLRFDPAKDGEISAAERLAKGQGGWDKVWQRFAENPTAFPGIPELLRRVEPEQMGLAVGGQDLSRWPSHNAACEEQVLAGLQALAGKSHAEACRCVRDLETQHRERRSWIWAQLGLSPMAKLLEPLGLLAQRADQPLVGSTPEEFIAPYTTDGWEADLSAWQAMAMATGGRSAGCPFSKRALLSVRRPRPRDVRMMDGPSKVAASSSTRVVPSETSANSAPKMPAITAGFSVSAITRWSADSVRSWPSSVVMVSPSFWPLPCW